MKADQERVAKLLNDTVTLLCKNGLIYRNQLTVQGLLGITLDKNEVFIVHINETIGSPSATADTAASRQSSSKAPSNVVDLTNVSDSPSMPTQAPVRFNPISTQMSLSPRRPRMPANVLLQQMQRMRMGNYLPQGFNPGAMPFMQIPSGNPGRPSGRLPLPPALKQRQPTNQRRPTTVPVQQQSVTVSLLDEDDVVIIGTGREEPQPNSRRSQQHRPGLRPFSQKTTRTPNTNNLQPIVIGQGSFSNIDICQDDRVGPSSFPDPKNYLGEIIIEPSNINDVEEARIVSSITGTDVSATTATLVEDIQGEMIPMATSDQDSTGLAMVDRVSPVSDRREEVMVYMDVADDDMRNNVKPDPVIEDTPVINSSEPAKDCPELMDEEPINYESVGLHMLTEDDDDDMQATLVPWKCKVPSCRSVFSEPSLLAGHYVHNHTDQISHLTNIEVESIIKRDEILICPDSGQGIAGINFEPGEGMISGPGLETRHGNTNNENIFEHENDSVSFTNQCLHSSLSMETGISESDYPHNDSSNAITEASSCTEQTLYDGGGLRPKDAQCSSSVSLIERDLSPCNTSALVMNMQSGYDDDDDENFKSCSVETPLLSGITSGENLGLLEDCESQAHDSCSQAITDTFPTDMSDSVLLGDCGTETHHSNEQTIGDSLSSDMTVKKE